LAKAKHRLPLSSLLLKDEASVYHRTYLFLHLSLILDECVFTNELLHLLDVFDLYTRYHLLDSRALLFNVCVLC
jgi:hypothetical protein